MVGSVQEALEGLSAKLMGWLEELVLLLPNAAVAVLVLFLAWFLARLFSGLTRRGLRRMTDHDALVDLVGRIVRLTVIAAGLAMALSILQLDKAVTSLLAGAGILALVIGFAFQDLTANFVAGVVFAVRRPFRTGHIIESNGHKGIVEHLALRTTRLRTFQGQLIWIPNRKIFEEPMVNFSELGVRRVDLEVGVSYGDDLAKVRRVTLDALEPLPRLAGRPVEFFFEGFGDSSVDFTVRFWIAFALESDWLEARSQAVMAIHRAYDEADITIPFPIRTLDFGIVGGRTLAEQLEEHAPRRPG